MNLLRSSEVSNLKSSLRRLIAIDCISSHCGLSIPSAIVSNNIDIKIVIDLLLGSSIAIYFFFSNIIIHEFRARVKFPPASNFKIRGDLFPGPASFLEKNGSVPKTYPRFTVVKR